MSDEQNRTSATRECDLSITSMITDKIGRSPFFQLIKTMKKFGKEIYIGYTFP